MRNAGRGVARVDVAALVRAIAGRRRELRVGSLNECARQIGISHTTLIRIVNHHVPPDAHNLAAVLYWLGERYWWIETQQERADQERQDHEG